MAAKSITLVRASLCSGNARILVYVGVGRIELSLLLAQVPSLIGMCLFGLGHGFSLTDNPVYQDLALRQ